MRCQECSAFLCRLCIKNDGGKTVCGGCGGACLPATGEELHTAAVRQTVVMRKRDSTGVVPPPPPPPAPGKGTLAALREKGSATQSAPPPPVLTTMTPATAPGTGDSTQEKLPPPSFKKCAPYFCKNHPEKKAVRVCDVCRDEFCDACVKIVLENHRCQECGAQLQIIPPEEQGFPPQSLGAKLHDALTFPMRGEGKLMLVLGGIFLALGSFDWRARGATVAYMYAYLMKTCRTSAIGRNTPPEWPGSEDYFGISYFAIAKILSLLPAILFLVITGTSILGFFSGVRPPKPHVYHSRHFQVQPDEDPAPVASASSADDESEEGGYGMHIVLPYFGLSLLGGIYLPMAILACVLFRTKEVLNPIFVFGSIAKVRRDYLLAYIVLCVAEIAGFIGMLSGAFIPLIGNALVQPIWLYLMMVQMRVMGDLYCTNRNKLAWFAKSEAQEVEVAA